MTRTLVACLLVSGCTSMTVSPSAISDRVDASCSGAPFSEYGKCIESSFDARIPNWRSDQTAPRWLVYIQWAKDTGALVANGTVKDTDARAAALRFRRDVEGTLDLYPPELPTEFRRTGTNCTTVGLGGGVASTNCQ